MMYIRPYRSSVFLRRKSRDVALAASPGSTSRYPPQALLYTSIPCHGSSLANIAELNQQPDEAHSSSKDKGEEKLASLLGRGGLIITRSMEWANVVVGYRQEHRYALLDLQDKSAIRGFIVEKSHWLVRQLLRSRRPFKATVMDEAGRRLFTMRRPIWFFNSTIFIEMDGKVIGFVKSKWHPWRRICDLYQGKKQFASMENPGFWSWTFVVKDETGGILALIDRHYRSWGHEMLTDASRYIVRFGNEVSADGLKSASQNEPDKACIDDKDHDNEVHKVSQTVTVRKEEVSADGLKSVSQNEPDKACIDDKEHDNENIVFTVNRQLTLRERTCALALVVSLDNDYFSRHSGGAWLIPIPFLMGSGE